MSTAPTAPPPAVEAYDWENHSQGMAAERVPSGEHWLKVARVNFGNQNGPFQSQGGDPQIMIIACDDASRECTMMITLSKKAAWVLATLFRACDPPPSFKQMMDDGVEPQWFADPNFGPQNLLGRRFFARVEWKQGQNGQTFSDVTPLRNAKAEAALAAKEAAYAAEKAAQTAAPAASGPAPIAPPQMSQPPMMAAPSAPPPVASPPLPPPAPIAPPPQPGMTKEQAWAEVSAYWDRSNRPDKEEMKRNGWYAGVKAVARPENTFTNADWAQVADVAKVPF